MGSAVCAQERSGSLACCETVSVSDDRSGNLNQAFVFIKPHAQVPAVRALVTNMLTEQGITIIREGEIQGSVIDDKQYIDNHYYAIASKATLLTPDQLPVPSDKFLDKFGETWADVLAANKAMNAKQACEKFGLTADELDAKWRKITPVKFGGGFYCGYMSLNNDPPQEAYVFNPFFMTMRSKFTAPGSSIYFYCVQWEPNVLPWSDFRGKVLGPTDPAKAPVESIRRRILDQWEQLGLKTTPDGGDNGVHASASPFEGLAERTNWLESDIRDDAFGKRLLAMGMPVETIQAWAKDPQVTLPDGSKASVFDTLEDMDVEACASKLAELYLANK